MSELKIRIFDDDDESSHAWAKELRATIPHHDVDVLKHQRFLEELSTLAARRRDARDNGNESASSSSQSDPSDNAEYDDLLVDDVNVLVIDYDLLNLEKDENRFSTSVLSGEDISYLVRCYSLCDYIIVLNQYGKNPFNLKLRRNHRSFADLNIGSDQLADRGLWSHEWPNRQFRPWYWPVVPDELDAVKKCVREVRDNIDESILNHLAFKEEDLRFLSPNAMEFIAGSGAKDSMNPLEVTFRHFVENSTYGLKTKDQPWHPEETIPKIAVARIRRWLDGTILPAQNFFVDVPHLAVRLPSVVSPEASDDWHELCAHTKPDELDPEGRIGKFRYSKSHWLSRTVWWWHRVRGKRKDDDLLDLWRGDQPNHVFCEDISSFIDEEKARIFVADVPPPYEERYLLDPHATEELNLDGVTYEPRLRLMI